VGLLHPNGDRAFRFGDEGTEAFGKFMSILPTFCSWHDCGCSVNQASLEKAQNHAKPPKFDCSPHFITGFNNRNRFTDHNRGTGCSAERLAPSCSDDCRRHEGSIMDDSGRKTERLEASHFGDVGSNG
jgi:hypothetical protein